MNNLENLIDNAPVVDLVQALRSILVQHTRIEARVAHPGRESTIEYVCEQCSEDRLYHHWPCPTIEAIQESLA